jgi:hypothetical protein
VSPIDGLGEDYLFSMHMLQHILLGDIAPVFLLLALSRVIMRPATRRLVAVERALGASRIRSPGSALWFGLIYLWHIPALYGAAIDSESFTRHRARVLLHRRRRALVASDPAGADATADAGHVAVCVYRRGEAGPCGTRPVPDVVDERCLRALRDRAADLGPDSR